ncbi:MAG: peptidase M23 [Marinilabiliales bacterium]|nr:MAG: peptidase M23 [Marinilabiliales bacterium]
MMAEKTEKKGFVKKLRNRFRLVIYNDSTFEEVLSYKLTKLNVFTLFGSLAILLIALVIVLIAFTPLKEFIPGYPDGEISKNIVLNTLRTDSLEYELKLRDQYFTNIKSIIEGKDPVNYMNSPDTNIIYKDLDLSKSKEDSLLRIKIEDEQRYSLAIFNESKDKTQDKIHFYSPVKGIVTSHFDISNNHYGTDIASAQDEVVHAAHDGTVILSSWTVETGYILQIQNEANFVSVYKHLHKIMVEQGRHVNAGDPIAIVGNSGELTTGPHLHFELWHKGIPLNAEEYLSF